MHDNTPIHLLFQKSRKEDTMKCVEEIKVGVDEKKKTQGMRRDLAHFCGVLNTPSSSYQLNYSTRFGCFFYAFMGENWMTEIGREFGDW